MDGLPLPDPMPIGSHVEPDAPLTAAQLPGAKASFRSGRMPSRPFWVALILGILAVIVFTLSASALFVFGVGVALAFFLVPIVNWLQRRGWPRWVAAIAVVVVTLLGFLILAITISAVLVSQGIAFVQALPTYLDELGSTYAAAELPGWLRSAVDSIITAVQENAENVDQGLVVAGVIGGVVDLIGGLFAWFLLPFFLFYLLQGSAQDVALLLRSRAPALEG